MKSLGQAIEVWAETRKIRNTRQANLLKIALKLYILPKMGHQTVMQLTPSAFSAFCFQIDILDLNPVDTLKLFDQAFEERIEIGSISLQTRKNYRSALGQFFNWLKTQDWFSQSDKPFQPPELSRRVFTQRPLFKTYNGERLYGLLARDLTPELRSELEGYTSFWRRGSSTLSQSCSNSGRTFESQAEKRVWRLEQAEQEALDGTYSLAPVFKGVKERTITQRISYILRFGGWFVNIEGYSLHEFSLLLITSQALYKPYIDWLIQERNGDQTAAIKVLEAAISVAKYVSFHKSKATDWSDISVISFLRQQKQIYVDQDEKEKPAKQQEKWEQKKITHDQATEVVEYLYHNLCSSQYYLSTEDGSKRLERRDLSTIFDNWQTYLMIKILVYAPIRQEELCKLTIDGTLRPLEDSRGILRYAVRIKEHKRTSKTGKPRYYPLPSVLTQDITRFITEIRSLAINAPRTEEDWLKFWHFTQGAITRLEHRIQKAKTASVPDEKYIKSAEQRLRAMKNRLKAREAAKTNAENCDHLFFALGRSHPTSFCFSFEKVHHGSVTNRILKAMGNATLALFGEPKFLNPHGFRHIGSKHMRNIGKSDQKGKFSTFVGHSIEVDNDYANQLIHEYDLIECIIDDWWHEP